MREISKNPADPNLDGQWRHPEAIVDCGWLKDRLGDPGVRVYDCTTYLHYTDDHPSKPYEVGSGLAGYAASHIPCAAFWTSKTTYRRRTAPIASHCPISPTLPNALNG